VHHGLFLCVLLFCFKWFEECGIFWSLLFDVRQKWDRFS
jgi:hypothetical protein